MNRHSIPNRPVTPIPADNLQRNLAIAHPDQTRSLPHVGVMGDTYTILLSSTDTDGHYCLIDMFIPPGGGPPPHRHDFEESFSILEGEIEVTFRGEKSVARAGMTINIPANAPHSFTNGSQHPARMLCICSPGGQDEFFLAIGVPVASRTALAPKVDEATGAELMAKITSLLPKYRTEMVGV